MPDDETRIDALIRALRREGGEAATQLPDAIVHAYLTGRASAEEKSLVRRALIESPQFRRDLIALSDHLETLAAEDAALAYDAAPAPPFAAPDFAPPGRTPDRAVLEPSFWERLTAAVQRLVAVPRLVPSMAIAAALAILVLGTIPRISWSPMVAPGLSTSLDPATFARPRVPRGGEAFGSHEEAAEYALHGCLQLGDGSLELLPDSPAPPVPAPPLATLHILGRWRQKLEVVQVPLPEALRSSTSPESLDLQVWVAALPRSPEAPIELISFQPSERKMALAWDADASQRGVLVVTYPLGGSYHASACLPFDLGSE